MKRIVFLVMLVVVALLMVVKVNAANLYDSRFAVGGDQYSDRLPLKWLYNWGFETDLTKRLKLKNEGHSVMFNVGHPGSCPASKYAYAFDGKTPSCGAFGQVARLAPLYPSSFWQIGNEDDWTSNTPEEYAKWYKIFYDEIKKYDPNAKVGNSGLAFPRYNHPNKWRSKGLINDPYIKSLVAADSHNKDIYQNNAWVILWREAAKKLYGSYPVVDFWDIHVYPWASGEVQSQIADTKSSVKSFRTYLDFIGEGHKPLWVSEFSILSGKFGLVCSDLADCNTKSGGMVTYMQEITKWFVESKTVQKWFWYYAGPMDYNDKRLHSFLIFYDTTETLSNVGKTYQNLAGKYNDTFAPQINTLTVTSATKKNVQFTVTTHDDNSGIVEYWYSIGSQAGTDDISPWRSSLDIRNTFTTTITGLNIISNMFYVNVKVGDASENYSAVKSVKYTLAPLLGDANADGKVDVVDFSIWKSEYLGQKNTKIADFNKDGKVDILDFGAWKTEYLKNR